MAALFVLATLCVVAVVSLTAALSRRLPPRAVPLVFPVPAIAGILMLTARDSAVGPGIAGAAILCSCAALIVAMSTPEAQLSPWWWRRFERELRLSMVQSH